MNEWMQIYQKFGKKSQHKLTIEEAGHKVTRKNRLFYANVRVVLYVKEDFI